MSLFGGFGTTTNQNAGGGGGLFGSTNAQQPQPQTTGLFGNTQNQSANPQQQQQQPQPTGLFGSAQNQGANQQQQQPAPSLFGNTAPLQAQATQPAGLFGNTTGNANPSGTTGAGLFGGGTNTQQNQPTGATGGLFGTTNTNTQPNNTMATGGLFGNTQQQGTTGGGIFGSKPAGSTLFGSTAGNTLFGGQQQQQQQQQQPSQPQTLGLFGQSTANTGTLFGNNNTLGVSALGQPSTLGGSTLGASSLLSPRSGPSSNQNANDAATQYTKLTEKIEGVYNAWNTGSPHCRFQHAFYNLVDPNQVHLYSRPRNALNDAIWEKAVRENPDSTCFVPVIAIGFDNIRERVEAQSKQAEEQQQKLKDLKTRLENLSSRHSVSNVSRLQRASVAQTQITHRLLKLIQHLHLLIPAVRSSSIRPEEEQLRSKLEEIEDDLRKGRVKAKLNELWALLGAVNASIERGRAGSGEWAVVDEDGMGQIIQVLKDQQAGLAHLTKVLQRDRSDMAIVMGHSPNEDLPEGETLWDPSSTLRASALR